MDNDCIGRALSVRRLGLSAAISSAFLQCFVKIFGV